MEDIFKVKQGDTELLREFVDRFQRERMMIPQVPDNWAAMAFTSNLNEKSSEAMRRLKESLREFPDTTWNDVYSKYNTKLRIEEDTITQPRVDERASSRRLESEKRFGKNRSRHKEAGSSSRFRKGWDARGIDSNTDARIGDYSFNISTSAFVAVLRSMGDKNRQETSKPPSSKRTVNMISRGDEVNGVTYTTVNKTSKVTITHGKRVRHVLDEDGSSINIILLRVVNEMRARDKVVPKARSLFGFDNSSVITKGETMLTTFAEGVIKDTKFQVIDADMAYNMILGRPWIHDMDVVPSILLQVIKFPSQ
nr:uncharacterized protein LOC104116587 [Nicotiana tomentosiformis]